MEAVVVGNRATVILNGQRVHDNAVTEGITGGARRFVRVERLANREDGDLAEI